MNASYGFALAAIALWASLAAIGVALAHVPPLLLTGVALLIGSLVALPLSRFDLRQWRVPLPTLALGVYGLFGYHFVLFMALRLAPPVQANLVNYLWPLLIVLLAPLLLRGVPGREVRFRSLHAWAALVGFAGAAMVILGRAPASDLPTLDARSLTGYALAALAALMWSSYSLLSQRVAAFPTAAIGSFAAVSGVLSLLAHVALEPSVGLGAQDWALLVILGLGPMGAAFFLWDAALKRGDPRHIGLLSFITPLASTSLLLIVRQEPPNWTLLVAAALILGAAWMGTRR
jgi:drug/metabolite transporter (DMT)-like permease